ncbi:hypothetical protein TVAG_216460 [Trichomonas vaginalis G3]|uniref:Uncharacterized protein n=1 Tax=Trichomonas vaginalis (strain ATCC PRA-98 / G3) TaxID=412133 RepID=A2ENY0_TRIV3|nr:protein ubiquitination [Trichomonas vaginalis G3]EAY05670.1 hypothetical protein TVAG_216460 [Trichomonas vaginalis G3]KAI5553910.1 protein ubiquitination [Trichomonas vaginalis G3]|eukprot:XP_001317893.1 hypothetical protein [Trichomonas vaginalis G3]
MSNLNLDFQASAQNIREYIDNETLFDLFEADALQEILDLSSLNVSEFQSLVKLGSEKYKSGKLYPVIKGVKISDKPEPKNAILLLQIIRKKLHFKALDLAIKCLENSQTLSNQINQIKLQLNSNPENAMKAFGFTDFESVYKHFETLCDKDDITSIRLCCIAGLSEVRDTKSGRTILIYSAYKGNGKLVRYLVEGGCNLNAVNNNGNNAVIVAAGFSDVETVKFLIESGLDKNSRSEKFGLYPITNACWGGNVDIIKYLLSIGCDVNSVDNDKKSCLLTAAANGNLDAVKLLISLGADKNMKDKYGSNAIVLASINGHTEIIKYLHSIGFDVNSVDNEQISCMPNAASNGNLDAVKLLISLGADKNMKDKYDRNAIVLASINGHTEIIKYLHSIGFDVNSVSCDHHSCLLMAANNGHLDAVKLLISLGADKNMKNNYGNNAIALASNNGHTEVVKYLHSIGFDVT